MATHFCVGTGAEKRREWLSSEQKAALEAVVEHIGQPGKGISACDESGRTINPRFEKVGVEASEDKRRAYRQMLFEAEGAPDFISGAILDPETVFQKSDKGVPLPELLTKRGILPGVKVPTRAPISPARSVCPHVHSTDPVGRLPFTAVAHCVQAARLRRRDGDAGPRLARRAPARVPRRRLRLR